MTVSQALVGSVGWLTLNRPDKLNSLTRDMVEQMTATLKAWRDDAAVRVVALTGTGRAFCAGADLKQGNAELQPGDKDSLDIIVEFFDTLRNFPKPVIVAVNGLALAGGMEIVLSCDIVLAAESARFGDAHSNFGVFPGGGGAALLPRKVPDNVARYLLFTGDSLGAAEMKTYGFVNEVLPDAGLAERAQALADKLAEKSPLVLARMKRVAAGANDKTTAEAIRHELLELRDHKRSYDIQEGLRAFAEKRKPQFRGY
ncbi:Enoyl-CoA hydratase/isomerase [Cupriavidus taiwanensis]|uniref:Enoyl-CoA hydratase/isomerase n=1 Tax=Cupriavidus taiwanensis TaxID=164546 RepID=A0A976G418_9BURK|nr:enoyl-CoA hydratase/isomerase family protein [Cupriavidus taiwanensis]SOZ64610.1 Enoyl-CoA hydratase/isomerase [Cupriavidus taiwanensis]SOZ65519.1 Enoyl-CoA hydratase/isomerase [Cupriavidus taiwanensis]SOZ69098.1 Enoyl-CoA hydratase/isomerase [Cupriavidus taiwanensis]SPA08356.1 Enoyl-CoA hydratase/isomerase [Cupriavidus taiwanensis]